MADNQKEILHKALRKGQHVKLRPNCIRVGFSENSFFVEYAVVKNQKVLDDNADLESDSSVMMEFDPKMIPGITSILIETHNAYKQKHGVEDEQSDVCTNSIVEK